jgi:serine/threonine protein phosphatase PrpC
VVSVRKIDVSDNAIEEIPDNFFENLPELEIFVACKNRLRRLPASIVRSHLIVLNISSNPIEELPEQFPQLLEQLFVSFCGLSALPRSLSSNPELIVLTAASNSLLEIPELLHLQMVNLSRNRLIDFPEFPSGMQHIDLSCNQISELPNISFPSLLSLDMSFNKLHSLAALRCPKLFSLKLVHNPVRGVLDCDGLPNLKELAIYDTDLDVPGDNPKPKVLTSQAFQPKALLARVVTISSSAAVAESRGNREIYEDVIVVRQDAGLFALFDAHNGCKTAELISLELVKSCLSKFDEKLIIGVVESKLKAAKHRKIVDVASCAIVSRKGDEIVFLQNGNVKILLIDREGSVTIVESENPRKYEYPQLAEQQNVGTWLVYGIDYRPVAKKRRIPEDVKWLLLASKGIMESVGIALIGEMAAQAESAVALVYDLRAFAASMMSSENLSVIAVDLTK